MQDLTRKFKEEARARSFKRFKVRTQTLELFSYVWIWGKTLTLCKGDFDWLVFLVGIGLDWF